MADTEDDQLETLLPPRQAAARLGIAPSTLRRLGPIYERATGDQLPWEGSDSGGGRLWPSTAVDRLAAARALVAEGRSKSLDNALRALEGGAQPSGSLARPDDAAAVAEGLKAALEAIQDDLKALPALRSEVRELHADLSRLRDELRARDRPPLPGPGRLIAYGDAPPTTNAAGAQPDQGSDHGRVIDQTAEDGLAVRAARWLERLIRRGRG